MCVIISATACVCVNDSPLETTVMLCVETSNRKGNKVSVLHFLNHCLFGEE